MNRCNNVDSSMEKFSARSHFRKFFRKKWFPTDFLVFRIGSFCFTIFSWVSRGFSSIENFFGTSRLTTRTYFVLYSHSITRLTMNILRINFRRWRFYLLSSFPENIPLSFEMYFFASQIFKVKFLRWQSTNILDQIVNASSVVITSVKIVL
jgi:hypothetical protein